MKKELLVCPICQNQFQTLNSHIHFKHKLSTKEFLSKYPNTTLVLDSIKNIVSKSCKRSGCGKWMKGYEFTKERKKQYQKMNSGERNPFFGKTHTQKTRKKMSVNHADFTGDKNPLVKWLNKDPKNRRRYSQRLSESWKEKCKDPIQYEKLCKRNVQNVIKSMLNGNHHPYSNCETGWFVSNKFNLKLYYQSSYEKLFLKFCESSNKITALQKPNFVVSYIDSAGKDRNYFPDFVINQRVVIEIKPQSLLSVGNNKLKIDNGRKYCNDNGYKYMVVTEKELKNLDKILWNG